MAVIFTTALCAVSAGREVEQAEQKPTTAITTTATTTTTTTTAEEQTKPAVYYYDAVPLDAELQDYIIRKCWDNGIDPAVVMAMIDRESDYDPNDMGDDGQAYGLMQIWPKWHYERMQKLGCTDLLDPYQNVTVGIDYLCELLSRYDGDMAKALTAYNRGHYSGTVTEYAKAVLDNAERIGELNELY
jgi:soluble lytic murein transglycosylase-like protein